MKNRIAYFCSEYPRVSHTFIFREIQELRKGGLEILTAAVNPFILWPNITQSENVEAKQTFYLKNTNLLKIFFYHLLIITESPIKYLNAFFLTLKFIISHGVESLIKNIGYFVEAGIFICWLKRNKITHVHIHFPNPAATIILIAVKMHHFNYSISVHGPDIFYNTELNMLSEKIQGAIFVRCISHYCRSQLLRLIPHNQWKKIHIIHCGVNLNDYATVTVPNNNIRQILCVGRLTRNKAQHILLQACALLKKDVPPFHITFVGDGEDRLSLESLASSLSLNNDVTFTGWIGQGEIKEYYKKADLFVLPSFAEGVPVVLMEAMAMGIPVISTIIAGIPELIKDNENGLLAYPSDVKGLSGKIRIYLLDNLSVRTMFAKKARLSIEDSFNIQKSGKQLLNIFLNNEQLNDAALPLQ